MNIHRSLSTLAAILVLAVIASVATLSWAENLPLNDNTANLPANAPPMKTPKGLLADRDNDGISDWLQKKLFEVQPNEFLDVIVTFDRPVAAHAAQQAAGPFQVKRQFRIINGFSASMTAGQVRALARMPGVFRIEENFTVFATLDSANRDFGTAGARTDYGLTGNGVGICILDTGVDPNHEQLDGGKIAAFEDLIGTRTTPYDDHGHGTHVGSIAAGDGVGGTNASRYKGVAPGAKIYAGKVLNSAGSGTADQIIAGVDWCAGLSEVDIISMSLGSAGSSDGGDSISQAVNSAVASGKVAVVAAGNSGSSTSTVGSPAAASGAITVGAVAEWSSVAGDANNSDGIYLASFSSRGPTADGRTKPDIVAPGVSITAAKFNSTTDYVTYSGTSMATPFVAGTVALALEAYSANPGPVMVKTAIMDTAVDCGPPGADIDWGAGLIDGYAFISDAKGAIASHPFPTLQQIDGNVATNKTWSYPFSVQDTNAPIAVTINIDGQPICPLDDLYCLIGWLSWEWSPDLDAELWGPDGTRLATSTCMAGVDCGSYGRQETLHILPVKTGTYTLVVYPFDGEPNNGSGGTFTVDISTGPVGSGPVPIGETSCSDGVDNDGDEKTDCNDTDCVNDPCCVDSDKDGFVDCDDPCPEDINKQDPGICGCGVPDADFDSDGTADCYDGCSSDPNKTEPGVCGCGVADTDSDGDGTPDCDDQCPDDENKTDLGICGCEVADTDSDGDGTPDCNDLCPNDGNKIDPGICGCDVADTDSDNDGTPDCNEPIDPNNCSFCFKNACDGVCHPKEQGTQCPDCNSTPPNPSSGENCTNRFDDDGDGLIDCIDSDCSADPDCRSKGDSCTSDFQCKSGKCKNGYCR